MAEVTPIADTYIRDAILEIATQPIVDWELDRTLYLNGVDIDHTVDVSLNWLLESGELEREELPRKPGIQLLLPEFEQYIEFHTEMENAHYYYLSHTFPHNPLQKGFPNFDTIPAA